MRFIKYPLDYAYHRLETVGLQHSGRDRGWQGKSAYGVRLGKVGYPVEVFNKSSKYFSVNF